MSAGVAMLMLLAVLLSGERILKFVVGYREKRAWRQSTAAGGYVNAARAAYVNDVKDDAGWRDAEKVLNGRRPKWLAVEQAAGAPVIVDAKFSRLIGDFTNDEVTDLQLLIDVTEESS